LKPGDPEIERKARELYDVVVVGSGPAGSTAALYASRGKLRTLVLDKAPGAGALALTAKIANYPGVRGAPSGAELLKIMRLQALDFGAVFIQLPVQGVFLEADEKEIFTPEAVFHTRSLIVATGALERAQRLPGEEKFLGRGVSYCATCDGAFHEGREVVVVGDTEEAVEEAQFLAKHASRVTVLVPGKRILGPHADLPSSPRVEYLFQHRVVEILGDSRVEGVKAENPHGQEVFFPASGVFVYLSGTRPSVEFLHNVLPTTPEGYLVADEEMQTPVAGVFAAGDVRRPSVKQAVVAAADGAIAAMAADRFLHRRGKLVAQR